MEKKEIDLSKLEGEINIVEEQRKDEEIVKILNELESGAKMKNKYVIQEGAFILSFRSEI